MSWWPWSTQRQLDRIEATTAEIEYLANLINRRTKTMASQEAALNEALVEFFGSINAGLERIEAKLAEVAPQVDLSDEVAAIKAAQEAFTARVDADVNPPGDPPA